MCHSVMKKIGGLCIIAYAEPGPAGAVVFGARRNSLMGAFGKVNGTGKGSAPPVPEGPGPPSPYALT